MSKLNKLYLGYTFSIMSVCWALCIMCSLNGISLKDNYLLYIPYLLGGLSPTIASFISLKKSNNILNFKDWSKNIFDFKHNIYSYLTVIILSVILISSQCFICGYEKGAPLFVVIFMIPMMIIGGGLEEAGWRYILQPELEKKFSFTLSTIITAVIWWIWHLPLFFIQGVFQYGQNFFAFGINVLGLAFALASIRKNTNSVWLCVLFHSLINSLNGVYMINFDNIWGCVVTAIILIICSYALLLINKKKQIFN
ncbi:MAG: CPBP family intramembrane metalloprotease [Spirochaetales bacterium]|nr:CPBP family intramembrane metalloprotease [Spirochaetales bacterium]